MEGSNKEEEKKGAQDQNTIQPVNPENQINNVELTTDTEEKIKELEAKFSNVKFSQDEKDTLRQIFNDTAPGEETNSKLAKFLKECAEGQKRNRDANKELSKIAPLYDTHDFWDSQPVPKETDTVTAADFDKQIDDVKTVDDI